MNFSSKMKFQIFYIQLYKMKKQSDHQVLPEKKSKRNSKPNSNKQRRGTIHKYQRSLLQRFRNSASRQTQKTKLRRKRHHKAAQQKQIENQPSRISIDQMRRLILEGSEIQYDFTVNNQQTKKEILKQYKEKMEKVLGRKEASQYQKWLDKQDFNSLFKELGNSFLQKANKNIKQMEKKLSEHDYYRQHKTSTLNSYKSTIQNYITNCNGAKTPYSKDYQADLFRWIEEQNIAYQQLLEAEKKELRKRLAIAPNGPRKSTIKKQLELLDQKGDGLAQEYINDIKDLLSGGFLVDVRKNDNLRLLAELLGYGFSLRHSAFLDHKRFQKNFRHYTQATIKASSLTDKREYLTAAQQVIRSVRSSEKLMRCLTEFMNANPLCRRTRRLLQEHEIRELLKETMDFEFFDGDCSLNGITLCKEGRPKIYFNTFRFYSDDPEDDPEDNPEDEGTSEQIDLFKTFVFFTYLHEIPNYLVRSLEIASNQSKGSSSVPTIEAKDIQEERGFEFEQYMFGQAVIDIFYYEYGRFMEAQKQDIDLQEYFKQEEQKKKGIDPMLPMLLHMEFRQYPHQQYLSRRFPLNCCGTHSSRRLKPKE